MKTYLGVDIGGTAVKLGLLDEHGAVLQQRSASVNFDNYATPILDTVLAEIRHFLSDLPEKPKGIGVSTTGYVNRKTGIITGSWLPGWEGSCVVEAVEAATGLPATLENDGNCMCLGECWTGAGVGCENLLCVAIGTGIGGSAVVNGKLLGGPHGLAMEIGHVVTHRENGIPCGCGRSGCWERYASTSALVQQAKQAGLCCENGRELLELVRAEDTIAESVYDHWLDELADGFVDLLYLLDPEVILVGGGIAAAGEILLAPLREKIAARHMAVYRGKYELRAARLGNDANLVGAVKVLLDSGTV